MTRSRYIDSRGVSSFCYPALIISSIRHGPRFSNTEWEMNEDADLGWYVQVAKPGPVTYTGNDKSWVAKETYVQIAVYKLNIYNDQVKVYR
jgi:hypothetical protein